MGRKGIVWMLEKVVQLSDRSAIKHRCTSVSNLVSPIGPILAMVDFLLFSLNALLPVHISPSAHILYAEHNVVQVSEVITSDGLRKVYLDIAQAKY